MAEPIFFKKSELQSLLQKAYLGFNKINQMDIKDLFSTSPPAVFIGSKLEYPNVNIGILSPPENTEDAWIYDSPKTWQASKFSVQDIVKLRSALINSRFRAQVKIARNSSKLFENTQEIGLSKNTVDIEVKLSKKPNVKTMLDNIHSPIGAGARLENLKINDNVKIDRNVDKVFSDTDLKAKEGVIYLYEKGFEETKISQILSVGALGLKKNRILVPTRWSITASDDIIGKNLINEIKDFPIINEYYLFTGSYLGNYYYIALFPEVWSYELFEGYMPGALWNTSKDNITFATDYEFYEGRKDYASGTSGGYYAARIGVLGYLKNIKRQASVLVIRFETPEYSAPLGVFVVRTAGKITMNNAPFKFNTKEELLKNMNDMIMRRFNYDINNVLNKSLLLKRLNEQKKLFQF